MPLIFAQDGGQQQGRYPYSGGQLPGVLAQPGGFSHKGDRQLCR
jgi:hypothetical protein